MMREEALLLRGSDCRRSQPARADEHPEPPCLPPSSGRPRVGSRPPLTRATGIRLGRVTNPFLPNLNHHAPCVCAQWVDAADLRGRGVDLWPAVFWPAGLRPEVVGDSLRLLLPGGRVRRP